MEKDSITVTVLLDGVAYAKTLPLDFLDADRWELVRKAALAAIDEHRAK